MAHSNEAKKMEYPLELPPPEDPNERVDALALDLAYGAQQGLWSTDISILRGSGRKTTWASSLQGAFTIEDYLQQKWSGDYPSVDQLVAHGYMRVRVKLPSGQENYTITEKAFELVSAREHVSLTDEHSRSFEKMKDPRNVFVVHGRNANAYQELLTFLRAIDLHVIEWEEAVRATGKAAPYIDEVLAVGFAMAQAAIVFLTPDDEARLRAPYRHDNDPIYEVQLTPQARPNVLYEAGMARGLFGDKYVLIVELGQLRPFSDVAGKHTIRLDGTPEKRKELAQRLETAGCAVNTSGTHWLSAGDFGPDIVDFPYTRAADFIPAWNTSYHTLWLILDLQYALQTLARNPLDSLELTREKTAKAHEHAAQLRLADSEAGQRLGQIKMELEAILSGEWNPQSREYFARQTENCFQAFLKTIERNYERDHSG